MPWVLHYRAIVMTRFTLVSSKGNFRKPLKPLLAMPLCSGTITSLLLGVDFRTGKSALELYLWSPDNFFNVVSKRTIKLAEGDFSPNGVLQCTLSTPLNFQSGDVLGVYQLSNSTVHLFYTTQGTPPFGYNILDPDYYSSEFQVNTSGRPLFNDSLLLRLVTSEEYNKN